MQRRSVESSAWSARLTHESIKSFLSGAPASEPGLVFACTCTFAASGQHPSSLAGRWQRTGEAAAQGCAQDACRHACHAFIYEGSDSSAALVAEDDDVLHLFGDGKQHWGEE